MTAMISSSVRRLRAYSNDLDASQYGTLGVLVAALGVMIVSAFLG